MGQAAGSVAKHTWGGAWVLGYLLYTSGSSEVVTIHALFHVVLEEQK